MVRSPLLRFGPTSLEFLDPYRERQQAEKLRALSSEERRKWIASLSDDVAEAILHDWEFLARPNQLEPTDRPWVNWLVLAGRGFGKTRGSSQKQKQNRFTNSYGCG